MLTSPVQPSGKPRLSANFRGMSGPGHIVLCITSLVSLMHSLPPAFPPTGSHPGVVDGRQTLLSQKCQTSHLQHQGHFKFFPPSLRPNFKEVSMGVVATLGSPQMSKGPVQMTECVVQPLKVLVTNLKNMISPCLMILPLDPWFVPSCFTQNKRGRELRGHWASPHR